MSDTVLKTDDLEIISILLVYDFVPDEIQLEGCDKQPYLFYFYDPNASIIAYAYLAGKIKKLDSYDTDFVAKVIEHYLWEWTYQGAWEEKDIQRDLDEELKRLSSLPKMNLANLQK